MGRRALRKIDPTLDLSLYFREAADLPPTFDQSLLFENVRPLEVEVGSGKGLFLAATALRQPDNNFFGIEIAHKYAHYAAARLARQQSANAMLICGDALLLFRQWLPEASLSAVHVYFPDPWWKKRHKKRRVMNEHFLRDIERTLVGGGRLHFWTDVEEYFHTTLELIAAPEVGFDRTASVWPELAELPRFAREALEADALYSGYLERQDADIVALRKDEALMLSADLDYANLSSISAEIRQKLSRIRPATIGQAARIDGMTPAALIALLGHVRRREVKKIA